MRFMNPTCKGAGWAKSFARSAAGVVLIGAGLVISPAHAVMIGIGDPAPALAGYASDAATIQSRAVATSTFYGTLQDRSCVGFNAQAWSCRDFVDSQDYQANRVEQTTATSDPVSAARTNQAFDTGSGLVGAFADYTIATATARAQTDYGSNKAEATARNAATWSETRYLDGDVGEIKTETDFVSSSIAAASSLWTDVIETVSAGVVKLVFSLKLHAAELFATFIGTVPDAAVEVRDGDGSAGFTVQLFDLGQPMEYGDGDTYPYVDSYALVAEGLITLLATDPNGTQTLELLFVAEAGGRYSLVSQLVLEVMDNARLDLFGTASLDRIEVEAGQMLTFASGTNYNVCDPVCASVEPDPDPGTGTVPEPATLALLGLGLAGLVVTRRRKQN